MSGKLNLKSPGINVTRINDGVGLRLNPSAERPARFNEAEDRLLGSGDSVEIPIAGFRVAIGAHESLC